MLRLLIIAIGLGGLSEAQAWTPSGTVTPILVGQHGSYGNSSKGRATFDARTREVLTKLDRARRECYGLQASYRVPCLYTEYEAIAKDIRRDRDFAPVSAVLRETATTLRATARPVRDRSQPNIRVPLPAQGAVPARVSRPIVPIQPAAAPQVNRTAATVLDRAAQALLRSTPTTDPRAQNFQRIAAAFNDSAVLLRS